MVDMVKVEFIDKEGSQCSYKDASYVKVTDGVYGIRDAFCIGKYGDPNCNHQRDGYEVEKEGGFVYVSFHCTICGEELHYCLGEVIIPRHYNII